MHSPQWVQGRKGGETEVVRPYARGQVDEFKYEFIFVCGQHATRAG